jgi:hypothetical protein
MNLPRTRPGFTVPSIMVSERFSMNRVLSDVGSLLMKTPAHVKTYLARHCMQVDVVRMKFCQGEARGTRNSPYRASKAIDFAPMAKRDEKEFISADIAGVDDAVVTHAESEFRAALETGVGKIVQPPAQFADARQNSILNVCGKTEENRIELAGVDLRGLTHGMSNFSDPHTALSQVGLAALDASDELRIQIGLIFEVIGQPILKLNGLAGRKLPHFSFDGFKLAHAGNLPLAACQVKKQIRAEKSAGQPPRRK